MSADRENHDMTQTDIALLLADAADEVEIGIAPVQAVLRGGRRRRTRRWAVAAATAVVVLAGSAGATLAVTGLPGEHRTQVAHQVSDVTVPQVSELAHGTDQGKRWQVVLSVWAAPRDRAEAAEQLKAMRKFGIAAGALPRLDELVGKTSHYTGLNYGDERLRPIMFDTVTKWEKLTGHDLESAGVPLSKEDGEGANRLVVGMVADTARLVECTFDNGTSYFARPTAAAGSPVNWYVCLAPQGVRPKTAEVIK
ncbi:hypothetical protein ACIRQQ_33100 [Streptomyces fuscichromogenes]|uniref:hypothetical protein n=1 Tax=Streptomyces fuscichromogenes TaxID=1324013 RepID=UPI00381C0F9C